jgi:NAD(P)-dependent dehydrogenase (short-subunit alcohol dehydrogenase family)
VIAPPSRASDGAGITGSYWPACATVNNAGGTTSVHSAISESDPRVWRETLLAKVYGPYLFACAVLPSMLQRKSGRIITVASRAGTAAMPGAGDYAVAKAAAIRLSESISAETREHGVTAFSLHPGGVVNPSVAKAIEQGLVPSERFPDSSATMVCSMSVNAFVVVG